MNFDAFATRLAWSEQVTVHNVRLIDVKPGEDGHDLLVIEHAGQVRELLGGGAWNEAHSRFDAGRFGFVVTALPFAGIGRPGGYYFRAYLDQSLRRVPDLDAGARESGDEGRAVAVVGWCCDQQPNGFRAPVGLIPGEGGGFVADETIAVTVRVPREFVRECHRVQMSPEELLRSFVGDLAGIQNGVVRPRADGLTSNGSDERDLADQWLERAHGMNAIDLDALEEATQEDQEKQFQRDNFADLLAEFEDCGGEAGDLFAAVQALVDKQRATDGD